MRRGAKRPTRRRLAAPIAVLLGRAGLAPEPAGAPARAPKRREAGARPFAVCGSPAAPQRVGREAARRSENGKRLARGEGSQAVLPRRIRASRPSLSWRRDCFLGLAFRLIFGEKKRGGGEGALGAASSESFRRRPGGG